MRTTISTAVACVLAGLAHAQTSEASALRLAQNEPNRATIESTNQDQKSSRNDENQLSEIVVTAQKRAERLQDVPASITALPGDQIEKVAPQSLADIAGYVPGLTVTNGVGRNGTPGQTQITLRGIASQGTFGSLVGVYIDDVPVGASTTYAWSSYFSPDLMPYDLDRVEVLRGPQGTLYGAGTMGGLVKYAYKAPRLDQFSGRAGVTANSVDNSGGIGGGVRASVNVPLINDSLGIRVSGFHQKTQGYVDDIGLNKDHANPYTQDGGRVAALWKASDSLSIKASALLQDIDATGGADELVDPMTLEPIGGNYETLSYTERSFAQKTRIYSISADWDASFATLTAISSWEKSDIVWTSDFTATFRPLVSAMTGLAANEIFSPYPQVIGLEKFTQEVRLASPEGQRFTWMLGAFYTHEKSDQALTVKAVNASADPIPGADPVYANITPATYKEIAPFVNGTVNFNDSFAITAGLRYAKNRQDVGVAAYGLLLGRTSPPSPFESSSSEGVTTWMVSPQWHPNTNSMLYGRVATGYRAGGIDPPTGNPFDADTLTSYEVGYKGTLVANRLSVDVSVFDIEWDKMQAYTCPNICFLGNADTVRSRGIEAATRYILSGLRIGVSVGFADAQLTADAPAIGGKSGDPLGKTPKWNGALTLDYSRPLSQRLTMEVGGGYRFSGQIWSEPPSSPTARRSRQARPVDLYLGVEASSLAARLFVRNAFNSENEITFVPNPTSFAPNSLGISAYQPRTIGLSLDWNF